MDTLYDDVIRAFVTLFFVVAAATFGYYFVQDGGVQSLLALNFVALVVVTFILSFPMGVLYASVWIPIAERVRGHLPELLATAFGFAVMVLSGLATWYMARAVYVGLIA